MCVDVCVCARAYVINAKTVYYSIIRTHNIHITMKIDHFNEIFNNFLNFLFHNLNRLSCNVSRS